MTLYKNIIPYFDRFKYNEFELDLATEQFRLTFGKRINVEKKKQITLFFHGFEFMLGHDLGSLDINIILLDDLFLKLSDIDDVRKMVKRLFGSIFAFFVLS